MKNAIVFLLLLFSFSAVAQDDDYYGEKKKEEETVKKKESIRDKTFLQRCYSGGNFSLSLGTFGSYIELNPVFGYNLTEELSVGVSASYKYFSGNNPAWGISYRTHVYGGSVFSRLLLGERFLMQAELEMLNTEVYDVVKNALVRKFIPIGLGGIGIRSGIGAQSYSYFLLMYDFIRDPGSPYPFSPFVIKVGVAFPIVPQ